MTRLLHILLKSIGFVCLLCLCVSVLAFYALQLPEVQTNLTQKATQWLGEKLGGKVTVGHTKIKWLDEIVFEDVNIKDLEGRDMIYVRELYVNCKTNFSFDPKEIIKFDNNLDYILLKNPDVKLVMEASGDLNIDNWIASINKLTESKDPNQKSKPIPAFTIDQAEIKGGVVSFEDAAFKHLPSNMFDNSHFKFEDINADLSKVFILDDTVSFKAKSVSAIDKKSKLTIKNIKTDFLYSWSAMFLDNLTAEINNSTITNSLRFYYERPSAFNDFYHKVSMKGHLKNCVLDAQDLGRFAPEMYAYHEKYLLDSELSGKFVDIIFKDFKLKFGEKSNLNGTAHFIGFPDLLTTRSDIQLNQSYLQDIDCKQYSSNPDYQKYLAKIGGLTLSGDFKGLYDDFTSTVDLKSTGLGKASGLINVKLANESMNSTYFGDMNIENFELGKLVDNEEKLGKISFKGKLKGKGLKINDASVELDGMVSQIFYNNYSFQNLKVNGKLGQSIFDGNINILDPNIVANIQGVVDFNKQLNSFKIKGLIDKINFKQLGLSQRDISLKTDLDFDFIGNKLDDWVGKAQFQNTAISEKQKTLAIDSLFINSYIADNNRRFTLNSEFFSGFIDGKYVPSQLISDVLTMVDEYNLFLFTSPEKRQEYYNKKHSYSNFSDAKYGLEFKKSKPFFDFFEPRLVASAGSTIDGQFNSNANFVSNVKAQFDTLSFDGNSFINTVIDVKSTKDFNQPQVAAFLKANSQYQHLKGDVLTQNAVITANWTQADLINFSSNLLQIDTKSYANILGKIELKPENFIVKIDEKVSNLALMNNIWSISEINQIVVDQNEISFENLSLTNKNQKVSWEGYISENPKKDGTLTIENFDLITLRPFTNTDLKGIATGQLKLKDFYKNPYFSSNLHIEGFTYENSLIGNINSEGIWDNINNQLNINGNIFRIDKEILSISGIYNPEIKTNPMLLQAKVRDVDLSMFEGLLKDVMTDLNGNGSGDLKISGLPLDPIIEGEINLKQVALKLASTASYLYFDDKILCTKRGFETPSTGIILKDAQQGGNLAELKGGIFKVKNNNYKIGLAINIKSKDGFKILNSKVADNEDFYGTAMATGDVAISGDFENVIVSGNLQSKKGTKITIPLDSKKKIDVKEEGIPFVGKKLMLTNIEDDIKQKVSTSGVAMNFNLTFTPDAECEIIFDRLTGDILNVFGDGKLSINYNTKGEFTLNGPFVVKTGKYNFSLQNLASLRKFSIIDGSRITWSGDPYEGILDLKAAYTTNIPINKIARSLTTTDVNTRYPVNIIVALTDRLMTPSIKYDVNFDMKQIPMAQQTDILAFEQKLKNDEQLLSRNVSSILVFSEIFPDNIAEALTQQFLIDNVSNLLSNQIGNLANKLNPNLEFGVKFGDFKQNILNNMQFNFSLKFLNNRAKLSGKSSFINGLDNTLSTSTAYQNQLSVGGELEYLLSQDGQYKFKLYSRSVPNNYYLTATNGNVIVSGGNFIISRNFNSFFGNKKHKLFPSSPEIPLKDSVIINTSSIQ